MLNAQRINVHAQSAAEVFNRDDNRSSPEEMHYFHGTRMFIAASTRARGSILILQKGLIRCNNHILQTHGMTYFLGEGGGAADTGKRTQGQSEINLKKKLATRCRVNAFTEKPTRVTLSDYECVPVTFQL